MTLDIIAIVNRNNLLFTHDYGVHEESTGILRFFVERGLLSLVIVFITIIFFTNFLNKCNSSLLSRFLSCITEIWKLFQEDWQWFQEKSKSFGCFYKREYPSSLKGKYGWSEKSIEKVILNQLENTE